VVESDLDQVTNLAQRLNDLCATGPGLTIATAESCTGGNIAARITSIAGRSTYFLGGIVSYANSAKRELLGVSAEILESPGAVSPECAQAMAEGARRAFRADLAIATTGIAGPGGATARKSDGLVYNALATTDDVTVQEHHFTGDRSAVIARATETALQWLVHTIVARQGISGKAE